MISRADLTLHFPDTLVTAGDVDRCADIVPRSTFYYYFLLGEVSGTDVDLITVSEDELDDPFAAFVLQSARATQARETLQLGSLAANEHGFDTLVIAPPTYHAYMKGRLDAERETLFLCIPAYACEFTGEEDVEQFKLLTNRVIPHRRWSRRPHPQFQFRFDNPKTGGGTGDGYVFGTFDLLIRELANLDGIVQGFIEIINYKGEVLELLSPAPGDVITIRSRDDATRSPISRDAAGDMLWEFLTAR